MEVEGPVAVAGATGRQGGAVVRHLLAAGTAVRALTRRPGSRAARELAAAGAQVVAADYADRASLERALAGARAAYSVQNPWGVGAAVEVAQGVALGEAAAAAGVRHVVYGSAGPGTAGTGVPSWESKVVVAARYRELGLPLTVLRPTAFMELMSDRSFYPAVSTWGVMPRLLGEDRPVTWLRVDDLGAVAARAFADPEGFVGADLALASDVRSLAECRAAWRRATGRAPRALPVPVRVFERLVGDDLPTMWRWLRDHDVPVDVALVRRLVPGAATVDSWLAATTRPRARRRRT